MHANVTPLGSSVDDGATVADKVVRYVEGEALDKGGRRPGRPHQVQGAAPDGAVSYYADSSERDGRWFGCGLAGMRRSGAVDPDELRRLLVGEDVDTGDVLLGPSGSAARAARERSTIDVSPIGPAEEELTLTEAAALTGVSERYLRRLAVKGEQARLAHAAAIATGTDPPNAPDAFLDARRTESRGRGWRVTRRELGRFMAQRTAPDVIVGYDITFSAPKSVSILWATASLRERIEIVTAIDEGVATGIVYLEAQGLRVRVKGESVQAGGMLAAGYLHATSRALDPQLHVHVVVANMAEGPDGKVRALDGRALFAHQKTAGYLAGVQMRNRLSQRLGVQWGDVVNGLADIDGIGRNVIRAMSRRAIEIDEATASDGTNSARARQMAAYDTRAPKDQPVDEAALRGEWLARLADVGFSLEDRARVLGRQQPVALSGEERNRLVRRLASASGVTEFEGAFSRQDVIQKVAEATNDRVPASDVEAIADEFLAGSGVIPLLVEHDPTKLHEQLYSLDRVLGIERELVELFDSGLNQGAAVVPLVTVEQAIAECSTLGADQSAMVRAITTSGHRLQCVLGPAGSGKSFAANVAARAWEAAGFEVRGVAVSGTAAKVIGEKAAVTYETVEGLLTRIETATTPFLHDRVVILVDEASTIGNRDFLRLARHVTATGAAVRLIGDPDQHTAVTTGGAWRYLVERHRRHTPELTENRRQRGAEMQQVREALLEFRSRDIDAAISRLMADDRVRQADSPDELFDSLVADWYVDRTRRRFNPELAPSSMTALRHAERRELNQRARQRLIDDGTIYGPMLEVEGVEWQAGDEVIAQMQDRALRPEAGGRQDYVRNGSRGVVRNVFLDGPRRGLEVDFEGLGTVDVPITFLAAEARRGLIGGLTYSYCITTHKAEGETHEAARHLASERTGREGLYVGLTRASSDVAVYVLRDADLHPSDDPLLPTLRSDEDVVGLLTKRLHADDHERLVGELDRNAAGVHAVRGAHDLNGLESLAASGDRLAERAAEAERESVVLRALQRPPAIVGNMFGSRPTPAQPRSAWDKLTGDCALLLARRPDAQASLVAAVQGQPPVGDHELWRIALRAERLIAMKAPDPTSALLDERNGITRRLGGPPVGVINQLDDVVEQMGPLLDEWYRARLRAEPPDQSTEVQRRLLDLQRRAVGLRAELTVTPDALRLRTVMAIQRNHVRDAVMNPAPYLRRVLGPRGRAKDIAAWESQAAAIERFRQEVLGVDPSDGPRSTETGLASAIGPIPSDAVLALQWRRVAALVNVTPAAGTGPQREVG